MSDLYNENTGELVREVICKITSVLNDNKYHIEFNGETHTVAEWSRITGINHITLYSRIFQKGWSIERALTDKSTL